MIDATAPTAPTTAPEPTAPGLDAQRTALVVPAWYALPEHRLVAIPAVIVAVYLVTVAVLARRRPQLATVPR